MSTCHLSHIYMSTVSRLYVHCLTFACPLSYVYMSAVHCLTSAVHCLVSAFPLSHVHMCAASSGYNHHCSLGSKNSISAASCLHVSCLVSHVHSHVDMSTVSCLHVHMFLVPCLMSTLMSICPLSHVYMSTLMSTYVRHASRLLL